MPPAVLLLSGGLDWSEVLGASDIFIGVNALDYSGYPDCRPEYVAAFQRMANLATKGGVEGTLPVRLQTPLLQLTKRQIVELGLSLGVDYTLTLSCYDPSDDGRACGHCDSCQLRRRGFTEAGVTDPTRYVGVD
jgi:7-cyano-7-deazaguanine synthase